MTSKVEKIVNYSKYYDTSLWSLDCLYCKLHNPEKAIDTWYDCNECCAEFVQKPKEYIFKQRYKMKLIRNILVPQPAPQPVNVVIETEEQKTQDDGVEVNIDSIEPYFYIKGINQLNEFMKSGRKYLEKNIGIEFEQDFCKSLQSSKYEHQDIGIQDLIFKIDFSKSRPTTKTGALFLHLLLTGVYTLDQMIGLAVTNKLNKLQ